MFCQIFLFQWEMHWHRIRELHSLCQFIAPLTRDSLTLNFLALLWMIPLCFVCVRSCSRHPGAGLWRRLVCGQRECTTEVSSQGQPACPALQMDQVCKHYTHNGHSAQCLEWVQECWCRFPELISISRWSLWFTSPIVAFKLSDFNATSVMPKYCTHSK